MALRTVTMSELRLEVLLEAEQSGESASEICRRYMISRETYCRYRGCRTNVDGRARVSRRV